jgi:glyoxylase-like metal-dependent hydrolase (beta-lactamase superfamily II)
VLRAPGEDPLQANASNPLRAYSRDNDPVEVWEPEPAGVVRVRADNPSSLTLDGTNTYVVGRWVVDPGPADPAHLTAVRAVAGEVEGVVLTHAHADHSESAESFGVPVHTPGEGEQAGPFRALATPGHSADSVCLLVGRICFTGDTVLGTGSVFISPGEGSLGAYLESLRRLRGLDLEALCPGHGPYVWDPRAKLDEYIGHRLERERMLLAALGAGRRSPGDLLDVAWGDVPAHLRPAAALSLQAHLEKLEQEGRLPEGVSASGIGRLAAPGPAPPRR